MKQELIRTGIDIVEIERVERAIQRYQARLLQRIFSEAELNQIGNNVQSLSARFAAKEAVAKALGTGIGKVSWKDIEIFRGESGEPVLHLSRTATCVANELGIKHWSISLSHTHSIAVAVAVGYC